MLLRRKNKSKATCSMAFLMASKVNDMAQETPEPKSPLGLTLLDEIFTATSFFLSSLALADLPGNPTALAGLLANKAQKGGSSIVRCQVLPQSSVGGRRVTCSRARVLA